MPLVTVTKAQGTGNDFVLLDNRARVPYRYPELARFLCDRRFGIGADGLLVIEPASDGARADVALRIFNADGSEAETCGNGLRCVARSCADRAHPDRPQTLRVETPAGLSIVQTLGEPGRPVRVEMGIPRVAQLEGAAGKAARVDIGNPHAVHFVDDDVERIDLAQHAFAARMRGHDALNVEVARVVGGEIAMRVHERGVGETWACGSGACAVAAAAISAGLARSPVRVRMRGGAVSVAWAGDGQPAFLTGPASIVFTTSLDLPDAMLEPAADAHQTRTPSQAAR
jgi:diaminopimelate epimerase